MEEISDEILDFGGYKLSLTLYFERINHGLIMSKIIFSQENIIIVDSTDYFDDDSEHEDYYTIEPNNYLDVINRLEKDYKPLPIENLNHEVRKDFRYVVDNDTRKIFLLVLSIIGYDKNIKEDDEKYIRGEDLIKILCGDEIKYTYNIYSRGA